VGRHASDAAGKDFAAFGYEFLKKIGILVIDRFDGDVDATTRHRPISTAESGAAFGCFRLHEGLFGLAMEGMLPQEPIVFFLLQAIRGLRTLLVSLAHITRDRLPERFGLGAFERDDFLGHRNYSFVS
jgi:hypothetical protein